MTTTASPARGDDLHPVTGHHVTGHHVTGSTEVRVVLESTRPWGRFEQFCLNEPATVKLITVAPGERLSLQRHARREEVWQVLDVPLSVTVGQHAWTAQPGERVVVPRGAVHRLGNPGDRAGRVLELAFGAFDEDDIERLHDDYTR